MKGLNEFLNEMFDAPRFWVKKNFGQFSVVDRENKDKMIVGYSKKEDAEKTANGLLASDEKDLEDIIKKLKTTSGYSMFLESINEAKSKFNLKDFEFYKSRNSKGEIYSFYHKPTELEADIYLGYGSFGRGSSERTAYVDYLEFVEEPDENTVEDLEMFIEDNLDYIFKNAEKIG
jgi:hypothetical protein